MKTSENKNSNAKPIETENGNMMLPLTPGPVHSRDTTEHDEGQQDTDRRQISAA